MPTDEILSEILVNLKKQNIKFGSFEIKFTFHDGRITFYETDIHKRQNVNFANSKKGQVSL